MEESFKLIMLWVFVGVFSGIFYWGALFMFCSGFYTQYIKANKNIKPLVIFTHMSFVPTLALILLGLYVVYNAVIKEISIWFIFGAISPVILIMYKMKNKHV